MNQEMIEALLNWLMWIGLDALLLIAAVCAYVGLRRLGKALCVRLRPTAIGVFAVVAIVATGEAQKQMLRGGALGDRALPSVTAEEIAQGWRLVAETNCEADIYAMPDGITPSFNWHKRGPFGEWARLDLGDFAFPLGTNGGAVTSFSVFNDGRIRPTPRDAASEICAVGVPMLAMQGASRFWTADGTSGSKLLTWENFFLNADTNLPVNAQIELLQNGDFTTRSNVLERIYRRVEPFDWDGDGLENTVDPEPLVAGPDAHGTNAEWYNVVCSNVLEAVEGDGSAGTPRPTLSWLDGVNSNAYYFVDVVATNCLAPIYFTGDRESRLGNPVVVVRAFETNHVPLLIGINYAVTSSVPFTVSIPDDGFASVTTNGVSNYEVQWPLNFVFTESIDGENRVYSVTVEPYDPGGELTWSGAGGGMRSGTPSGCDCGCLHCSGYSVWFSCSAICTCGGACQAVGNYTVEDALFAVTGGVCRCGFDDPCEVETETTNPPPISVSFSRHAVIFEDAYEARRGVMMPKRSSRVRITVDAYGGDYGGVLSLTSANLGKLTSIGKGVTLHQNLTLAANERFHTSGVYEGSAQSTEENDVSVSGTFTEYFTAQQHLSSNRLTVVKIKLKPNVTAPKNDALGRHEYGVCELVRHEQHPSVPVVTWNPVGGGSNTVNDGGTPCYKFPLFACENPLRVELGDATYLPRLSCIEPSGIEVREVDLCTYGLPAGKAGGIGLLQAFYVKPFTVSFSQIAVEEVPSNDGSVVGYFRYALSSNLWSHTSSAGAGEWHDVTVHNRMGDTRFRDEAAISFEMLPITPDGTLTNDYSFSWMAGEMTWDVPFGWNVKGTANGTAPFDTFEGTIQEFYIDATGFTGVRKFYNQATRSIDDVRHLNWKRIFNNEVRNPLR